MASTTGDGSDGLELIVLIVCFITEKKRKKGDIFPDSIKPKGKCIGKVRVHSTAGLNQPGDSSLQALRSG